jgi:hypothetical protein
MSYGFRRLGIVAAGLLTIAAAGCGGSSLTVDSSAPPGGDAGSDHVTGVVDTGASPNCQAPAVIDPTALIDDMEGGTSAIAMIGGRNGAWWAGGDATPGGVIQPNGLMTPEVIPGGRCGSHYAQRVTGYGFTDWGAVVVMNFRYGTLPDAGGTMGDLPIDAHFRTGITFWARIGDTSSNNIRFSVGDEHSQPEGGLCIPNGPIGQNCYDTFGVPLPQLTTEWQHFQIPFLGLTQLGFGVPAPTVDTSNLYTVQFSLQPGTIFDLWIDDISFY